MEVTHLLRRLVLPPGGLLLLALLAVLTRRRFPRASRGLAAAALGAFWMLSTPGVSFFLYRSLSNERVLTAADLGVLKADAILVLGGGLRSDSPEYGQPQPTLSSLERLRYGLWLERQLHLPVVLSSGNTDPSRSQISEAETMARVAREQRGTARLILEERSLTTWENARECARLLLPQGLRRVLLVTELHHMRRARRCFEQHGFEVVAAPMGSQLAGRFERGAFAWLPSYPALNRSSMALEEWLGNLIYSLRTVKS